MYAIKIAPINSGISVVYVMQDIGVRLFGRDNSCLGLVIWDGTAHIRKPSRRHRHTEISLREPQGSRALCLF